MSFAMQRKIWSLALDGCKPAAKMILLYLLYRADHEDGTCFPSVDLIVRESGYSRRTVQRSLRQLEDLGHVTRLAREGRSNVYRLDAQFIAGKTGVSMTPRCATVTPITNHLTKNPLNPPQSGGNRKINNLRKEKTNLRTRGENPRQRAADERAKRDDQWVVHGLDWKFALQSYFTDGFWNNEAYGCPPPGEKGCNIPLQMVQRAQTLWGAGGAA